MSERSRLFVFKVSASIGTGTNVIIGPVAVGGYKTLGVHVENTGGSNFNLGRVEVAPLLDLGTRYQGGPGPGVGQDSSWWRAIDVATFGSLAAGSGTTLVIADSPWQQLRVVAGVAAGSTSGTAFIFGGTP